MNLSIGESVFGQRWLKIGKPVQRTGLEKTIRRIKMSSLPVQIVVAAFQDEKAADQVADQLKAAKNAKI